MVHHSCLIIYPIAFLWLPSYPTKLFQTDLTFAAAGLKYSTRLAVDSDKDVPVISVFGINLYS